MTLFRLKKRCGNHIEKDKKGNLVTYTSKPGSNLVESDKDLIVMYPSKFELVQEQVSKGGVVTTPDIPEPSKKKGKAKIAAPEIEVSESKYGVDVSSKFPTASKVELKVFEKSNWFTIIDPDDNKVLSDKKLRRGKVEDFLAEYLEPEDEDEEKDEDEDEDEDVDKDENEEKDEDDDEDEDEGD